MQPTDGVHGDAGQGGEVILLSYDGLVAGQGDEVIKDPRLPD